MAKRGKWVLVLALAAAAPARGQEKLDTAGLDGWLGGVRPEIEKALGYALPQLPRLQLVEREPVYLDGKEAALHLRGRFPHLGPQEFERALQDAVAVCAQADVARHVEGSTTILVFPDHHLRMPRWTAALQSAEPAGAGKDAKPEWHDVLKDTATANFVRLVLIHETVRQALDTRHGVGRRRDACRDADEWFALQALVEGRCQHVTLKVARQLQLEELFPALAARYLYVPDVSPDPGLRTTSQAVVRQKHWACMQGLAFWTYLESQGKADEQTLFDQPPRRVKWIERPDTFLRVAASQRPDLDTVLSTLEPQLPGSAWAALQQPWTPEMFVQVAGLLNEKARAEKVTRGWEDGRSVIWSWKNSPACNVALSLVRYETAQGARGYFGFALDLQRKRDELSNQPCGLPLKVIDSRTHNISLPDTDECVLFEKKMQYANSPQTLSAHILLVRQGERVVEVTWYGLPADTAWAQRMLAALPR